MTNTWDRIEELLALKPGWLDGEGQAPSAPVLLAAGRLVDSIPCPPGTVRIYPTPEGGVELEWDDANLNHAITIGPDRRLHLLTIDREEVAPS
jgi:hypothetical protein